MSMRLPTNPEIKQLFDVTDLAAKNWVSYRDAKHSAREFFESETSKGIKSLTYLVLRADDKVQLITIGPKGGVRVRWTFGRATRSY